MIDVLSESASSKSLVRECLVWLKVVVKFGIPSMTQRDLLETLGVSLVTEGNILSDICYFQTLFAQERTFEFEFHSNIWCGCSG